MKANYLTQKSVSISYDIERDVVIAKCPFCRAKHEAGFVQKGEDCEAPKGSLKYWDVKNTCGHFCGFMQGYKETVALFQGGLNEGC